MKTEKMLITPQIAEQFLLQNTNNRNIKRGVLNKYIEDMKNGDWKLMPHGIVFLEDGTLSDGQHRLTAVVKSGVSCEFMVTTNAPKETSLHQDTGATRLIQDSLKIGGNDWASASTIAIVKCMTKNQQLSQSQIVKIASKEIIEAVVFVDKLFSTKVKYLTISPIAAAIALAKLNGVCDSELISFVKILTLGFGDGGRDNTVLALRNYILKAGTDFGGRGLEGREKCIRAVMFSIRNYINQKEVKKVTIPDYLVYKKLEF